MLEHLSGRGAVEVQHRVGMLPQGAGWAVCADGTAERCLHSGGFGRARHNTNDAPRRNGQASSGHCVGGHVGKRGKGAVVTCC